jgi:hypothetical protein
MLITWRNDPTTPPDADQSGEEPSPTPSASGEDGTMQMTITKEGTMIDTLVQLKASK